MRAGKWFNLMMERYTELAIVGTALAVVLACLSLIMPFFTTSYTPLDGGSASIIRFYGSDLDSFMNSLSWSIAIWALYGVLYIAWCLHGGNIVIRGGILQVLCVVPPVFFVASIVNAVNSLEATFPVEDLTGHINFHPADGSTRIWGPSTGFFLLLFACLIQYTVVTARSAPILARILSDRRARSSSPSDSEDMQ